MYHSDPSKDNNSRIVRQLENVLERYHIIFNGLNNLKKSASHYNVYAKKRKTLKFNQSLCGEAIKYVGFWFFFGGGRSWNLTPPPRITGDECTRLLNTRYAGTCLPTPVLIINPSQVVYNFPYKCERIEWQ